MITRGGPAEMFACADKSSVITNERNLAKIDIGYVGSDTVNRNVTLAINFISIVVLVSRRRFVDHNQSIGFQVYTLTKGVT